MAWDLKENLPIYSQILEHIEAEIISGVYAPGAKLPSVRELAAQANVNPNTMQRAFSELERSGLVLTQRNAGRTVTEDAALIQEHRTQYARKEIEEFILTMTSIGYSKQEIKALLESLL